MAAIDGVEMLDMPLFPTIIISTIPKRLLISNSRNTGTVNLIVSLILARYYGIAGILLGTFISSMTTVVWIEPLVVYKNGFKKNVTDYFKRFIGYALATLAAAILTSLISSFIPEDRLVNFSLRVMICIIVPNSFFLLIFSRTDEFKSVLEIIKGVIKRKKRLNLNSSE